MHILHKSIYIITSIFILVALATNILSKNKKYPYKHLIAYEQRESENENPVSIIFEDKSGKKVHTEKFDYGSHSIYGYYRIKGMDFLYFGGYSGGESGCCTDVYFYYWNGQKIESINFQESAYGPFKIIDADNDKDEEFMTYSERFYGYTIKQNNSCVLNTRPLYVNGFSDPVFPVFRKLISDKPNQYKIVDVSFDSKYIEAITPYLLKAETYLENNINSIADEENIRGVLQYYYYKTKLNQEEDALDKIKKANLQIQYEGKNCKKEKLHTRIKHNRNQLLSNKQ